MSSLVLGLVLSGELGWPLLVVLTMGLLSRTMSSLSVVILVLCVEGREGEVSAGWECLEGFGLGRGVVVLFVFVLLGLVVVVCEGGWFLFELVVGEVFWVGCVCEVES